MSAAERAIMYLRRIFEDEDAERWTPNGALAVEILDWLETNPKPDDDDDGTRWIPVSERLPEIGRPVLVTWGDSHYAVLIYTGERGWWDEAVSDQEESPTHWMPIPPLESEEP